MPFGSSYFAPGIFMMGGMDRVVPEAGAPAGSASYGYGHLGQAGGAGGSQLTIKNGNVVSAHGSALNTRRMLGAGLGVGAGTILLGAGLSEHGLSARGLYDSAVYEVATGSAVQRFHHGKGPIKGAPGMIARPGIVSGMGSGATAGVRAVNSLKFAGRLATGGLGGGFGSIIGGTIGSIAGTPGEIVGSTAGMFGGAYLGVAMASNPAVAAMAGVAALGTGLAVGSAAAVGYGTYATLRAGYRHRQMQKGIHTSGSLAAFHTQGAQTMRARAVSAIHKSHMNARSALGQEANFMHFPSRNYHSRYRR